MTNTASYQLGDQPKNSCLSKMELISHQCHSIILGLIRHSKMSKNLSPPISCSTILSMKLPGQDPRQQLQFQPSCLYSNQKRRRAKEVQGKCLSSKEHNVKLCPAHTHMTPCKDKRRAGKHCFLGGCVCS